jgi:type IV pilus assembly protein PilF
MTSYFPSIVMTRKAIIYFGFCMLLLGCAGKEIKPPADKASVDTAEVNVKAAVQYLQEGNPQQALSKVLVALNDNPEYVPAYSVAGRIYESYGQPKLAEKYLRRAIELAPQSASGYLDYGKFLCNQQRFKEAEENFLIATTRKEDRAAEVGYTNAGLCAMKIPDLDRSAQYFRAALEANPKMAVPYYQLARINFEKQRYPQAQRYLQSFAFYGDHTPKSLWLGISIERALGNTQKRQQYMKLLRDRFPNSEEALMLSIEKLQR